MKDGLGPCGSVWRPKSWHCAFGKAQVEETNGGSGRKEGIAFICHGSEKFGVEEEMSTMAMQSWAEGVWIGKLAREQKLGESGFPRSKRGGK